ncbi:fimbrial protein [Paraburkholderia elongata]|uniref:Fimbrial protein n=1 Tax=Paraburkholderia elongata TaxID=2675747 RepID=A0A972NI01_9BURK|nr:fimbrial protein [Paraburkholderia elongata]NPT53356.1 fimbrial protein [Paraburkholderia elongata]
MKGLGFNVANVDFGSVTVPANVAVGTLIKSTGVFYNTINPGQQFWCGASVPTTLSFQMSGTGAAGVYATNIPGIGIKILTFANTGYGIPSGTMPVVWTWNTSGPYYFQNMSFAIQLVVTGPVDLSATTALSYNVNPWLAIQPTDGSAAPLAVSGLAVTATIVPRTCSVTTSAVDVPLPTVNPGNLNTGSAGAKQFNLGVNCTQGVTVKVTLTDASNVSNVSTTLSLAPGSTATGVGLQILFGSTPIAFGPDSAVAGNMNQWTAGTAAGGPMNIPLTVQYIRTGTVNPGTVKGLATFTMSYQ